MALVGGFIWLTNTNLSTDTEGGWVLSLKMIYLCNSTKKVDPGHEIFYAPSKKSPFSSSYGLSRPLLYAFGRVPSGCSNNEASPNFVSFPFATSVDVYIFLLLPGRLQHLTFSFILCWIFKGHIRFKVPWFQKRVEHIPNVCCCLCGGSL